ATRGRGASPAAAPGSGAPVPLGEVGGDPADAGADRVWLDRGCDGADRSVRDMRQVDVLP
ncbi:hypothetical protein, partial [Streptomyces sp. NPDC054901]